MAGVKFSHLVQDLKDDRMGTKGPGKKAAEAFRKAAADGKDLSPFVPFLIEAYLDSQQLPVMCPISDALAIHYLNSQEADKLNELLSRKAFGNYLTASIRDLAKRRKDVSLAIPGVIKAFASTDSSVSKLDVSSVVKPWVRGKKFRLLQVTFWMLAQPSTTALYPWLLRECLEDLKEDGSDFIPILGGLFVGGNTRLITEALHAILFLASRGASLQKIVPALEKLLAHENEDVRYYSSHSLGLYYVNINNINSIDQYVSSGDDQVRLGMVLTLFSAFRRSEMKKSDMVMRLAMFLIDPAEKVRTQATQWFEGTRKGDVDMCADDQTLARLLPSLTNGIYTANLSRYLFACISKNENHAQVLLKLLEKAPVDQNHPAVQELRKSCEEKIKGTLNNVCVICKALPCCEKYTSEYDVPKELEQLEELAYGSFRKCPVCNTYYSYSFSQEYESPSEGMGVNTEIGITRLSPPVALAKLQGKDLEGFRKNYDQMLNDCRRNLTHSLQHVRENSAWTLYHHDMANGLIAEVTELLQNPDGAIRILIAEQLSSRTIDPTPFLAALTQRLKDQEVRVRNFCSQALSHHFFEKKQFEKFNQLLDCEDPEVKRMAVLKISSVGEETDIRSFFPVLKKLILHPDAALRGTNSYALRHAKAEEIPSIVEILKEALQNPDPGIKMDALKTLETFSNAHQDISAAIPLVGPLLGDRSERGCISVGYFANCVLMAAQRAGFNVSIAFPYLIDLMMKQVEGERSTDMISYLILPMTGVDHSLAVPALAKMLLEGQRTRTCALDALERLSEEGGTDISGAIENLKKLLFDDNEFDRRRALNALTWQYLSRKSWKEIQEFLSHDRQHIRANSTAVIREAAKKGMDVSPLIPFLTPNVVHLYDYLRSDTHEVLAMLLKQNQEHSREILSHLEKLKGLEKFPPAMALTTRCRKL